MTEMTDNALTYEYLNHIDPACAVSFSGHRPNRLPGQGDPAKSETKAYASKLREQIEGAVGRGKHIFLNGAMAGWDILAAEQVLEVKKKLPQIELVTIVPFAIHYFTKADCWTQTWIERTREICRRHDFGISIAEHYRNGIYYERNRALIDHSSELICYWDGEEGGTKHTVDYAAEKNISVTNLCDHLRLI